MIHILELLRHEHRNVDAGIGLITLSKVAHCSEKNKYAFVYAIESLSKDTAQSVYRNFDTRMYWCMNVISILLFLYVKYTVQGQSIIICHIRISHVCVGTHINLE